jgi:hypothetical protein
VARDWWLVAGGWLLVAGCWWLVAGSSLEHPDLSNQPLASSLQLPISSL